MFYGGEILDGTYQIIKNIGKGGTGVIYKAYHMRLKKYVVVKLLDTSRVSREKVRVEVDILKGLHHMYLPQVYDFLEVGQDVYTIMDYIEGRDLEHYLKDGYVFKEETLILWLKQLCEVLGYLHSQKPPIYHSDIKPGNIMVTPEGNICLIDFNISLGSGYQAGILGLSQWYAAPEQYEKAELFTKGLDSSRIVLDGRMDIYSLGATFYTLMSGLLPDRQGGEFLPLNSMHLPYSSALVHIVEKAMEERPRKRFATAQAMHRALDYIYKMDAGYRRLQKISWFLWGGCGLLLVAGILCCTYSWKESAREDYRRDYQEFYETAQKYEDENTISIGIDIVNNSRYRGILTDNPEDKAQILYMIGNIYYGLEDYASAEEYFQEAAQEDSEPLYYRDQALAAAKQGNTAEAENVLDQARQEGMENDQILLARQEVAFAKEDFEEVLSIGERLENSQDSDTAAYSCILTSKVWGKTGDYDAQAEYLEKAYALGGDNRCLRELGSSYLTAAENVSRSSREMYLKRARECYEKLEESYGVTYRDQLNLAVICEELGDYQEAKSRLELMEESYPEEYQIYMHLAYICLKQGEEEPEDDSYYEEAVSYYREARTAYRQAGSPEDSSMAELEDYMES